MGCGSSTKVSVVNQRKTISASGKDRKVPLLTSRGGACVERTKNAEVTKAPSSDTKGKAKRGVLGMVKVTKTTKPGGKKLNRTRSDETQDTSNNPDTAIKAPSGGNHQNSPSERLARCISEPMGTQDPKGVTSSVGYDILKTSRHNTHVNNVCSSCPEQGMRDYNSESELSRDQDSAMRHLDALIYGDDLSPVFRQRHFSFGSGASSPGVDPAHVQCQISGEWESEVTSLDISHLPLLTRDHIISHNKGQFDSNGDSYWAPYKGLVYSAKRVYDKYRDAIEKAIGADQAKQKHKDIFENRKLYPLIFHYLPWFEMLNDMVQVSRDVVLGRTRTDGWHDEDSKFKAEVQDATVVATLLQDLQDSSGSGIQGVFLDLLRRYSYTCGRSRNPSGCDTNQSPFPLDVEPESLRAWITNWVSFDFTPPTWSPPELFYNDDVTDGVIVWTRTWLAEWQPFDHVIDGVTSWNTLPDDVIAKDETSPQQEILLAKREQRKHFTDKKQLLRRRKSLAKYFVRKYHYIDEITIQKFMEWAETMERAWEEFQRFARSGYFN